MKKVLFLAYHYPPSGGAGVQRTVKFVKHLPEFGYQPILVAGTGRSNKELVSIDFTLNSEVNTTKTYWTKLTGVDNFIRVLFSNNLVKRIPGIAFKWWMRAAERMCEKVIETEKPDVIFVTVCPYEAASVCLRLAQKYNTPWVLDMRDPWALDPISHYPTWWNYRYHFKTMARACQYANAIIMNTPRSLKTLRNTFSKLSSNKLFCITNGYDRDDIVKNRTASMTHSEHRQLTIIHTGQFHTQTAIKVDPRARMILKGHGKKLRDIPRYSPGKPNLLARTPYYLLKSIRKLLDTSQIKENDIKLVLIGVVTNEDISLIQSFNLEKIVEFKGYLNHNDTIRNLISADVLFLPLHEPENGHPPLIIPGKTYEYMAVKKPILALVPKGDTRDFVHKSGLGFICDPTNISQIAETLLALLREHRSSKGLIVNANEQFIEQFERKTLTEELAGVCDFAVCN